MGPNNVHDSAAAHRHERNVWKRFYLLCVAFSVATCAGMMIVGCGASGGNKSAASLSEGVQTNPMGRVAFAIKWPEDQSTDTRYIPLYAQSLYFEFYPVSDPSKRYQLVANRPVNGGSQTVSLDKLIAGGRYRVAAVARTGNDGQGSTVAIASDSFEVQDGKQAEVKLSLATTLHQLTILDQPLFLRTGTSLILTPQAKDSDGALLLLPASALKWSIVSGGSSGSIDANGLFIGIADGVARVRVEEVGAGLSAEVDVRVADAAFFAILDQPLVVKAGESQALSAGTVDLNGVASPIDPTRLKWSVVSGEKFLSVTPEGVLTGIADGSGRIRVEDSRLGLIAEADVSVQGFGNGVSVDVD